MNTLYYGDNLTIMRTMPSNLAHLIYLDPPFNSNRNYNLLYKNATGIKVPEQVEAFCDTWHLTESKEQMIRNIKLIFSEHNISAEYLMFWRLWIDALRHTQPKVLAYLVYMVYRLLEMKVILKPNGSIYLHCDPNMSHYIKVIMDSIFGHQNFRNEIIWHYQTGGVSKKHYAKKHDVILYYSKSNKYQFYADRIRVPRTEKSLKRAARPKGARIKSNDTTKLPMDVWCDIPALNPMSKERLGYPTQKPIALLERIIKASSNPGDIVFDPFSW